MAEFASLRSEAQSAHARDTITREDIFHYVYALLHHPDYRERYAENLKRELPRIPMTGAAEAFHAFAGAVAPRLISAYPRDAV